VLVQSKKLCLKFGEMNCAYRYTLVLTDSLAFSPDFIITQMFFDVEVFKTFVIDCRAWGITCPVVPGIICINAYAGFQKMVGFCKSRVPVALREKMDSIKDDAAAVKEFGTVYGTEMCNELVASGLIKILHFYTLNLEKVVYGVLDAMGWSENALASVNESDAASMVAKGSAWARVGDKVKTAFGDGVVEELVEATGAAKIKFDNSETPAAVLEKGDYSKIF
jgi:hypothetical protein